MARSDSGGISLHNDLGTQKHICFHMRYTFDSVSAVYHTAEHMAALHEHRKHGGFFNGVPRKYSEKHRRHASGSDPVRTRNR